VVDEALKEFIGKGNGTLGPMDSGVLEMILTLGWLGSIPYVGGLLLLLYFTALPDVMRYSNSN